MKLLKRLSLRILRQSMAGQRILPEIRNTGIRQLLGVEKDKIRNDEEAVKALEEWLCTGEDPLVDPTDIFFTKK